MQGLFCFVLDLEKKLCSPFFLEKKKKNGRLAPVLLLYLDIELYIKRTCILTLVLNKFSSMDTPLYHVSIQSPLSVDCGYSIGGLYQDAHFCKNHCVFFLYMD